MSKERGSGPGHYMRGEKRVEFTWGDKISTGLKGSENRKAEFVCQVCGKTQVGNILAKYCSRGCQYTNNYSNKSGVEKKAIVFGANLLMGDGKRDSLMKLIDDALMKPCPYCGQLITLDNCSLDHKEPYNSSKLRNHGSKTFRFHMDRLENLQITCTHCNQTKESFSDSEYRALIAFMDRHPSIAQKLKGRLARSSAMWSLKRKYER